MAGIDWTERLFRTSKGYFSTVEMLHAETIRRCEIFTAWTNQRMCGSDELSRALRRTLQ
jgi:hypothetical protein